MKSDYQNCFDSLRFPAIDAQIHTSAGAKKGSFSDYDLGILARPNYPEEPYGLQFSGI
jgi:hypothetical protein